MGHAMTGRADLRQIPERGSREWEAAFRILDAGFLASVGFCVDGQPFVIPMLYGREDRTLYLHGARLSRLLRELGHGCQVCVSVTHVDGLVLARSAFHHSMNYRSAVAFGAATAIETPREKIRALHVLSDHLIPGRWNEVRGPNKTEITDTAVVAFAMEDVTSKERTGLPKEDEDDYGRPVWAGVLPLTTETQPLVPDDRLVPGVEPRDYARLFRERRGR
jgi:nitroimidazol reductase NimA-like FMN-containing flavoprotein (pyridoxamine 5'-phosphate oxidase superfamily)